MDTIFSLDMTGAIRLIVALEIVALYLFLCSKLTKYNELEAIARGKVAAAISFAGDAVGIAIPLLAAMLMKLGFVDFLVWSAVAGGVQLTVMKIIDYAIPGELEEENVAAAIFFAAGAIVTGLLNAGAIVYL